MCLIVVLMKMMIESMMACGWVTFANWRFHSSKKKKKSMNLNAKEQKKQTQKKTHKATI